MVGGIKAPQRYPCLSQCKEPVNVNLYDKRNFTDVISQESGDREMIPDFLSRPDVVRKVLIRGMMEESGLGCHAKKEAEGSRVWKRSYYSTGCDEEKIAMSSF